MGKSVRNRLDKLADKYGVSQEYKEQKSNSAPVSDNVTERLETLKTKHSVKTNTQNSEPATSKVQTKAVSIDNAYNTYGEDGNGGITRMQNYDNYNKAVSDYQNEVKKEKVKQANQAIAYADIMAKKNNISNVALGNELIKENQKITGRVMPSITDQIKIMNMMGTDRQDKIGITNNENAKKVFTADQYTMPELVKLKNKADEEATQEAIEAAKKEAEANALAGVARNVYGGMVGGATSAIGTAVDKLQGKQVNTNASYNRLNQQANAAQETLQNKQADALGLEEGTLARKISDIGVGTGLSMLQTVARMPLAQVGVASKMGNTKTFVGKAINSMTSPSLASLQAGLSAGTNAMIDAKKRGATDGQAIGLGILQGTNEGLFESWSLGNLINDEPAKKGFKDAIKYMLGQTFAEGSEEAFTEIANDIADRVVMAEKSNYNTSVQNYLNAGLPEEEAKKQAEIDIIKEVGWSFAGGALSGLSFGGGKALMYNLGNNAEGSIQDHNIENRKENDTKVELIQKPKEENTVQVNNDTVENEQRLGKNEENPGKNVESFEKNNENIIQNEVQNNIDQDIIKNGNIQEGTAGNELLKSENAPSVSEQINPVEAETNSGINEEIKTGTGETRENNINENISQIINGTIGQKNTEQNEQGISQQNEDHEKLIDSAVRDLISGEATIDDAKYRGKFNEDDIDEIISRIEANNESKTQQTTSEEKNTVKPLMKPGEEMESVKSEEAKTVKGLERPGERYETPVQKAVYEATKNVTNKGKVDTSRVDRKTIGRKKQVHMDLLSGFVTSLGANVEWYTSKADENGKYHGDNGSYNPDTNTFTFDTNAGAMDINDAAKLNTAVAHEVTHWLQNNNAEAYDEIKRIVFDELNKDGSLEDRINRDLKHLNEAYGDGHTREQAEGEIIARACEDMLSESSKARDMLNQMSDSARESFVEKIRNLFDKIRGYYSDVLQRMNADSEEAKRIRYSLEGFDKLTKAWDKAVQESVGRYTESDKITGFEDGVASDGITLEGKKNIQLSERTWEKSGKAYLMDWLDRQSDLTREDKADVLGQINEVYKTMKTIRENEELTDYRQWASVENKDGKLTVITPNGEYPLNIDFSTVCKKRKALDHILNVMVQSGQIADAKDLAGTDIVKLQEIIKKNDLEVACALCFVDSKRYRVGEWADGLTNGMFNDDKKWQYGYNQLVDSLVPEGSNLQIDEFNYTDRKDVEQPSGKLIKDAKASELDFTLIDKIIKENAKGTWNRSLAEAIKNHPELRSHLNSAEILSSVGFDPIREQNPALFEIINEKGGSSKPKLSFSETAYVNDILMSDAMTPEAAYKVGGVRLQSFSDFMANMAFDYVQMIGELQAKKLPAHAYSKEASFVAMFGKTGIKINMSLVPAAVTEKIKTQYEKELAAAKNKTQREDIKKKYKNHAGLDENGNYIWADETFPYEVAMQFQADPEYAKNCGTIAVGVSNEHIIKLLNDTRIQMVIPYHSSGINPLVAALRNIDLYNDYTAFQNTRYSNGKKIDKKDNTFDFYESLSKTNDAKKTADEYLTWCDKKGFLPKFDQFRDNENYYKLLADFRLYDNEGNYAPQHAVGFAEDDKTINKNMYPENMQDLILNGYTTEYKDADGNTVEYKNGGLREAQKDSDKLKEKTRSIIKEYGYKKNYFEAGKYDYDKLIKKEPAKITDFEAYKVPIKNKKINLKEFRKTGGEGRDTLENGLYSQKYVFINDLGSRVIVNKDGITHGIQGRISNTSTMETAEVTNALSDILRNSVVVNESALKKENLDEGDYSYLLFGLARRSDGQMYLVRSRVNHRSDNMSIVEHIDIYDVLKGIKAKKIGSSVHGKSGENAELPITLTSKPNVTVAELLEIVKENNPEILPDSVREHFGIQGEKNEYVYYSDRDYIRSLEEDKINTKIEEITRDNLPLKAKVIVTKSRNNLIKELGKIIKADTVDNIKGFRALTNVMVDEYLETGKIKDSTIREMFNDAYKFSDAEKEMQVDDDLKRYQFEEFKRSVEELKNDLRMARRYAEDQVATKETTAEEVQEAYKGYVKARTAAERVRANTLLTSRDYSVLGMLLRGEATLDEVKKMDNLNHKGIEAVYAAQLPYEQKTKSIKKFNKERKAKLAEDADSYLQGSENWKDKTAGILYERETAERNIRDVAPKGEAEAIITNYFTPVHEAEADSTRYKNKYRDRVKELNISRKVAAGNKESESYAVQFIGEAEDNMRRASEKGEKGKQYGKTAEEWQVEIDNFFMENPNIDKEKIYGAIKEFSEIYRELREKANDVLIRNGYEPIEYRAGYFPHFQSQETDGIVNQFKKVFGVEADVTPLPTTINGMTGTFKPGRTWFGNVFSRKGHETKVDAVQGFDKYIQGISDVIHQTDNIQKLRALAQQIRYNASDESIQKEIDKIQANDELTWDEQRLAINELLDSNKEYALSNFVVWLDEYTNLLANKKSKLDRVAETEFGRRIYNAVKTIEGNVAGNMVALNPGSWLTNLIPITQAMTTTQQKYLLKGMVQTLKNEKVSDNFIDRSDFLTNRRGSDNLVKRFEQDANPIGLAKVSQNYAEIMDKLSVGMNIFDDFTAESIVRGRYLMNKAQGMSEAMAMAEADAYAASIMADRSKGAQPTLFGSRNPMVKAFTMFQLEVNNELSWMIKDVPRELKDKTKKEIAAALFKFLIGTYIFNDVYEFIVGRRPALDPLNILNDTVGDFTGYKLPNMIDAALGREGLKTKKKGIYESVANLAGNVAEELPFSALITGEGRIPVASGLPDLKEVAEAVLDDTHPKRKAEVAARQFGTSALYLALPGGGGQIKKIAEGAAAIAQGGSYKFDKNGNLNLQYPVYRDTLGDVIGASVKAALFGKSSLYTARKWVDNGFDTLNAKKTQMYEDLKSSGLSERKSFEIVKGLEGLSKKEKAEYLINSGLKEEALNNAYVSIQDSDDQQKTANDLAEANINGVSTKTYIEFKQYVGQKGIKKENVLEYIDGLKIDSQQKDYLYRSKGYAESELKKAPWNTEDNSENPYNSKFQTNAAVVTVDKPNYNEDFADFMDKTFESDLSDNEKAGNTVKQIDKLVKAEEFSMADVDYMYENYNMKDNPKLFKMLLTYAYTKLPEEQKKLSTNEFIDMYFENTQKHISERNGQTGKYQNGVYYGQKQKATGMKTGRNLDLAKP